jgi:hypothetical protein
MKGAHYLYLWLLITVVLGFENYRENHYPQKSVVVWMQNKHIIKKDVNLAPDPGKPISLVFGYAGFGIMLLTNLYIFRKRLKLLHGIGHLNNWLNFHIFCGLVGPTFILFHSNFKVRGLVAISFWSMIVSFASGVIGRYFYIQISKIKGDFVRESDAIWTRIMNYNTQQRINIAPEKLDKYKAHALQFAGAMNVSANPVGAFFQSAWGDIRLLFSTIPAPAEMGDAGKYLFQNYAVSVRRSLTTDNFVRLMGYWHTFHMPFAVFMYIAAIFHIAAALILGVAT